MSSDGSLKLNHAMKNLRRLWEEIEPLWRDQVREDFERTFILPLANQVNTTVRAMNDVHEISLRAKRECS